VTKRNGLGDVASRTRQVHASRKGSGERMGCEFEFFFVPPVHHGTAGPCGRCYGTTSALGDAPMSRGEEARQHDVAKKLLPGTKGGREQKWQRKCTNPRADRGQKQPLIQTTYAKVVRGYPYYPVKSGMLARRGLFGSGGKAQGKEPWGQCGG